MDVVVDLGSGRVSLEGWETVTELAVQVQLLRAGVLTIDEVRAQRGLAPLAQPTVPGIRD